MHNRLGFLLAVSLLQIPASATERTWNFDAPDPTGISIAGTLRPVDGVTGRGLGFEGNSLVRVADPDRLANAARGFTMSIWVNPYRLNDQQQMIAARNVYARNQREWSLMIDKDQRFRFYLWQGRWKTVESRSVPVPGKWHHLAIVIQPESARLWVDGQPSRVLELKNLIPQTPAALTLGGVDDAGRIWQNYTGAIDRLQLWDRPLEAREINDLYRPVKTRHSIPDWAKAAKDRPGYPLWAPDRVLPRTEDLTLLKGVEFHVIKKWEPQVDGYHWLHGVALAWHKGSLYASFGHNVGAENTFTEEGRYCVSQDGGKTWSEIRTIDSGTDSPDVAVSHGVFLSHNDQLWAFLGAFHGTRKRVHTRAYVLNDSSGQWQSRGTVVRNGFWPMTEPIRMQNGNWILPGFQVGSGNPAAVAISSGDDLSDWRDVVIAADPGVGTMWGESSVIVRGKQLINIARYGARGRALAAISKDFGNKWTRSSESNLPMATSKPCAGTLSSGQHYLIGTTTADSGTRRSPLTIAVTEPAGQQFVKVFMIRPAEFPAGPGESHPHAKLSYPYAIEHGGKLYVGYSNSGPRGGNRNSAELAVIPVDELKVSGEPDPVP